MSKVEVISTPEDLIQGDTGVGGKGKKKALKRIIRDRTTTTELEGELEGFKVTWRRSISVGLMRKLMTISKDLDADQSEEEEVDIEDLSPEERIEYEIKSRKETEDVLTRMEEIVDILSPRLVEWNLEDEKGSLPATKKGLLELDLDYLMELLTSFCTVLGELPKARR